MYWKVIGIPLSIIIILFGAKTIYLAKQIDLHNNTSIETSKNDIEIEYFSGRTVTSSEFSKAALKVHKATDLKGGAALIIFGFIFLYISIKRSKLII